MPPSPPTPRSPPPSIWCRGRRQRPALLAPSHPAGLRQATVDLWTPLLWMPRRQGPASLMVPVWPAVLWMEMRLGALRVPRRQWPASRGLPRRLEVLLREVEAEAEAVASSDQDLAMAALMAAAVASLWDSHSCQRPAAAETFSGASASRCVAPKCEGLDIVCRKACTLPTSPPPTLAAQPCACAAIQLRTRRPVVALLLELLPTSGPTVGWQLTRPLL